MCFSVYEWRIGQCNEWDFQGSLDWNLLEFKPHKNFQHYFKDLNNFYKTHPALFEIAFTDKGFEWISYDDHENCVISYIRKGDKKEERLIIVCNLTPAVRENYRIGVPDQSKLKEVFNSDAKKYGGNGVLNTKQVTATKTPWNGNNFPVVITLPPLGFTAFQIKV